MKVYREISLFNDFEFWGGAIAVASRLTAEEMGDIELILEDIYTKGLYDIEVNDIFWFEDKWICEMLGIDYDEFWERGANI